MLLGLISDTHGLLRPEVFTSFEGVDHILHAGDIGDPEILVELGAIAPVTAVFGNTDDSSVRTKVPEEAHLELEGVAIVIIHGHKLSVARAEVAAVAYPTADLILFGHSHQPEIYHHDHRLAVNPGSAGPGRFKLPVTVALAGISDGRVDARLVPLVAR